MMHKLQPLTVCNCICSTRRPWRLAPRAIYRRPSGRDREYQAAHGRRRALNLNSASPVSRHTRIASCLCANLGYYGDTMNYPLEPPSLQLIFARVVSFARNRSWRSVPTPEPATVPGFFFRAGLIGSFRMSRICFQFKTFAAGWGRERVLLSLLGSQKSRID